SRAAIERPARRRARRCVFEQRRLQSFLRLRVMNNGPTVILSFLDDVQFVASAWTIKSTRTMLSLKHQIRSRLPVHSLRVAMTERPDLWSNVLLAHERIVLRHGAIVVQAQRLACKRVEFLCELAIRGVA